jgi:hypothetical protein
MKRPDRQFPQTMTEKNIIFFKTKDKEKENCDNSNDSGGRATGRDDDKHDDDDDDNNNNKVH